MIAATKSIENELKNLLIDTTVAGCNVYINNIFPISIEDEDDTLKCIFIHFMGEKSTGNSGDLQHDLTADYDVSCLVAERKNESILETARTLSDQVQKIILKNSQGKSFYEIQYKGCNLLKDNQHTKPLVGFKLKFSIKYLANINI